MLQEMGALGTHILKIQAKQLCQANTLYAHISSNVIRSKFVVNRLLLLSTKYISAEKGRGRDRDIHKTNSFLICARRVWEQGMNNTRNKTHGRARLSYGNILIYQVIISIKNTRVYFYL